MALPSPTTLFLHSIFDSGECEDGIIRPTLPMLYSEEEDVFASAFKIADSFSGSDVKPNIPRSQPVLSPTQSSEMALDDAAACGIYRINGLPSPSWQPTEERWQLSSLATETCQSKVIHQPPVQSDSPSYPKSLSSPSSLNTSPNQRTEAPKRRRRKKPPPNSAKSKALRARFLARNRISAEICRRKRKDWIASLKEELEKQSTIATLLQAEHRDLMEEVKMIRGEASLHTECVLSHPSSLSDLQEVPKEVASTTETGEDEESEDEGLYKVEEVFVVVGAEQTDRDAGKWYETRKPRSCKILTSARVT